MTKTAIIPAAGTGTRLQPHTHSLPKALLPVGGRPVLGHIMEQLVAVGFERVVLVVGYRGDQIRDWLAGSYPQLRVDAVEQAERLGLGHAVHTALVGAEIETGPALVILGDTIVRADFAGLIAAPGHAMGVKAVADPRRFGVAVVEDGRIVDLEEKPEKPRSDLALVGVYHFADAAPLRRELGALIAADRRTRGEYQLTDALQAMIAAGEPLTPFAIDGWYDVGKAETWLETNAALLAGAPAPAPRPGVVFTPPVCVPDSAVLEDCRIGPDVSLGENCVIRASSVENSIVGEGANVSDCQLQASLIGAHARIAGVRGRANLGERCDIVGS